MKQIIINDSQSNQRLDKFLLKYFNKSSKSFVYKMLRKKRIKYNNAKASGNEIISAGDILDLYISPETQEDMIEIKEIIIAIPEFTVLFEDNNVLIVNKPAGLLCHPNNDIEKNTLVDQILYYLYEKGEYNPKENNSFIPGICNRLDRNTSGIVIAGKNLRSMQSLNEIIKGDAEKHYYALVKGWVTKNSTIKGYISKNRDTNEVEVTEKETEFSKQATTFIEPVTNNKKYTLLDAKIISGKPHQIRAHLKYAGFPVIGDKKYGEVPENIYFERKFSLNRQFLHNYKFIFKDIEGYLSYLSRKEIYCKLPNDLNSIKKSLFN